MNDVKDKKIIKQEKEIAELKKMLSCFFVDKPSFGYDGQQNTGPESCYR